METGSNKTDWLVAVSKGLVGALPFVGAPAAEVVGTVIPNQRIDRLEAFLRILDSKLSHLDRGLVRQKFLQPQYIDLLEDGFMQAARALTDERREHIAALLKNSLTDTDREHLQKKRLLGLLGEVNDLEILMLRAYTMWDAQRRAFEEAHPGLKLPHPLQGSSEAERERFAIHESYRLHLIGLGLLDERVRKTWDGKPEWDPYTGKQRIYGYETSELGKALLRMLDFGADPARQDA